MRLVLTNITTAELGRVIAVVEVTSQVNGNTQFSRSRHPKTVSAIKVKSGTSDCVGDEYPQPTFGKHRITGDLSPYGLNITFRRAPNNSFTHDAFLNKPLIEDSLNRF